MICVKNHGPATKDHKVSEIVRVSDEEAHKMVASRYWKYCPKSEWKKATRKPQSAA